jgi:hypothetical protein
MLRAFFDSAPYNEACFSRINFAAQATSYVKSSSRNRPICHITFLRPDSKAFFDASEPDLAGLATYQIISFKMDSLTIKSARIGANGYEKEFQVLNNGLIEQ